MERFKPVNETKKIKVHSSISSAIFAECPARDPTVKEGKKKTEPHEENFAASRRNNCGIATQQNFPRDAAKNGSGRNGGKDEEEKAIL